MRAPIDDAALDAIFRTARTANHYLPGAVTEADVHAIYDLVKMGPTSANTQPSRFVWLLDEPSKERLARHATGSNPDKIRAAPAAVVIAMDVDFHEQLPWLFPHAPDARNWFSDPVGREAAALRNGSLQAAYFIVAARALGFDVGPMSGFDAAAVDAEFFGDTPTVRSNIIATLGHADPATIFERSPRPDFARFNRIG